MFFENFAALPARPLYILRKDISTNQVVVIESMSTNQTSKPLEHFFNSIYKSKIIITTTNVLIFRENYVEAAADFFYFVF